MCLENKVPYQARHDYAPAEALARSAPRIFAGKTSLSESDKSFCAILYYVPAALRQAKAGSSPTTGRATPWP
jgi:hypothetical protein